MNGFLVPNSERSHCTGFQVLISAGHIGVNKVALLLLGEGQWNDADAVFIGGDVDQVGMFIRPGNGGITACVGNRAQILILNHDENGLRVIRKGDCLLYKCV